jgi:multimeric flavodoxin WrbA
MKIACLLGSPRTEGNSSTIARRFLKTAEMLGAETTAYELNQRTYRGCQACYACKTKLDRCVLKDDMAEVLDAVKAADVVVLASPVYYGEISSQLKGFMDRTFSYLVPDYRTNLQPSRLAPKKLIFVLTQGHPDEAAFADIFPRYEGFLKWQGFSDVKLIRACGVGPGSSESVPEQVLRLAEETAEALMRP